MDMFVTQEEWGASAPRATQRIAGPVRGVTLHWEGPHMGTFPHSKCAFKVRVIERFHQINRGWADIAYNLVVCPHGVVFEGRGVGIRSAANGTSNIGGNDRWYAVCYLGGQGDPFTAEAKDGFVRAVQMLRKGGAGGAVNGHRDHHATECPGSTIYRWLHVADFGAPTPGEDDMPTPHELMQHQITSDENGGRTFVQALRAIFTVRQSQKAIRADLTRVEAKVDAILAALPKR